MGEPTSFIEREIDALLLNQAVASATLSRSMSWQFMELGRRIERVSLMARLVDTVMAAKSEPSAADCVGLLKMCSAFEAYCRVHTAVVRPEAVIEFLVLDAEFPRSVRFAADQVATALTAIAGSGPRRSKPERVAGRLTGLLDNAGPEDLSGDRLSGFLDQTQALCYELHQAIHATYIDYPVEDYLPV